MNITSKQAEARTKVSAHIDENNNLSGRMNPLKLFFCPLGMDRTSIITGLWHFKDAINKLESQTGTSTDVVDNKMINATVFNPLLEPGGSFDPIPVNDALALDGTTDVLMIIAANPKADANQSCSFNIRDFDIGNFIGARARASGAAQGPRFTDDNGIDIQPVSTNTTNVDQVVVAAFNRGSLAEGHRNNGSATSIEDVNLSMVTANGPITFLSTPEISINADAYACGLYYFPNGLPANWKTVASSIGWEWTKQNYVVGPESWANL